MEEFFFSFLFEAGSHASQAGLKLIMQPRMKLNFQSFSLHLPSVQSTELQPHTQLMQYQESYPGPQAARRAHCQLRCVCVCMCVPTYLNPMKLIFVVSWLYIYIHTNPSVFLICLLFSPEFSLIIQVRMTPSSFQDNLGNTWLMLSLDKEIIFESLCSFLQPREVDGKELSRLTQNRYLSIHGISSRIFSRRETFKIQPNRKKKNIAVC